MGAGASSANCWWCRYPVVGRAPCIGRLGLCASNGQGETLPVVCTASSLLRGLLPGW